MIMGQLWGPRAHPTGNPGQEAPAAQPPVACIWGAEILPQGNFGYALKACQMTGTLT